MTIAQAKENFDKILSLIKREGVNELVEWLKNETDFFSSPASTKYHGNFEGGLLIHSINVVRIALHIFNLIVKEKPELEYLRESVVISALFHDVCKANTYVKEKKWTKDSDNKWKEYDAWVVKDNLPLGHGEKSLYLLAKFIKLTPAEAMAIRWHMGAMEPSINFLNSPQSYSYYEAFDHPLVLIIQTADLLSLLIEDKIDLKNI